MSEESKASDIVGTKDSAEITPQKGPEPLLATTSNDDVGRYLPRKRVLDMVDEPKRRRSGAMGILRDKLFWTAVVLPTTAFSIYFGAIASDEYISESRFVVRTPQRAQQPSLVGALLQGSGFMRSQDDAFTVHNFMLSRDAAAELDTSLSIKQGYSREDIDLLSRFPGLAGDESFESFYKYYKKRAVLDYDQASSITTLRVSAYSPKEAFEINSKLLLMGERLVNQINERGRRDLIKYATAEVAEAETKARAAALAVAVYRNQRAVFDPERQSALQLQQISRLQDEIIATKIQLSQLQALSPINPQIPNLQRRIKGLEQEMSSEMGKVAGAGNTLSNKAADFEKLTLERTFAERQVASALASLESARNEARRQQIYLERIVQPNLPDYPLEPRRLKLVFSALIFGLALWAVGRMLLSGIREHRE